MITAPAAITASAGIASSAWPVWLDPSALDSTWQQALAIALATLVSEDATAIGAGLLAGAGRLDWSVAIAGAAVGTWLGDLGLYAVGAATARGASGTAWIRRRMPLERIERTRTWATRHTWSAVFASRAASGSRLPLYLAAGFLGVGLRRFASATAVAVAIWTPILVLAAGTLGAKAIDALVARIGEAWYLPLAVFAGLLLLVHGLRATWSRRRPLAVRLDRATRFEFWPTWAIYAPLLPWFLAKSIRHGGVRTLTAVNPCWPDGGAVGESKQAGLEAFEPRFVAPSLLLQPGSEGRIAEERIDAAIAAIEAHGWVRRASDDDSADRRWIGPVIAKPDAGQRGLGVRMIESPEALRAHLRAVRAPIIVQRFESGTCEVGLFAIREGDGSAKLFSICDKRFAYAVGDGCSTLRTLIRRDPRLRLQEEVFLRRHAAKLDQVLASGEKMRLVNAGDHAQGCLFLDGERLRTPALEAWVAEACASAWGFRYGRLDVRFPDEDACRRGEGGVILEANGILSESTNMYDPSLGAIAAWRIMRGHWSAAFRVGAAQRGAGVRGIGWRELLGRWRDFRRSADLDAIAD